MPSCAVGSRFGEGTPERIQAAESIKVRALRIPALLRAGRLQESQTRRGTVRNSADRALRSHLDSDRTRTLPDAWLLGISSPATSERCVKEFRRASSPILRRATWRAATGWRVSCRDRAADGTAPRWTGIRPGGEDSPAVARYCRGNLDRSRLRGGFPGDRAGGPRRHRSPAPASLASLLFAQNRERVRSRQARATCQAAGSIGSAPPVASVSPVRAAVIFAAIKAGMPALVNDVLPGWVPLRRSGTSQNTRRSCGEALSRSPCGTLARSFEGGPSPPLH